jgi:hypothetical protein
MGWRGLRDLETGDLHFAEGGLQPAELSPMASAIGGPASGQARFSGASTGRASARQRGDADAEGPDRSKPRRPVEGLNGTIAFTSLAPARPRAGQTWMSPPSQRSCRSRTCTQLRARDNC